jgi:hypothetical protein
MKKEPIYNRAGFGGKHGVYRGDFPRRRNCVATELMTYSCASAADLTPAPVYTSARLVPLRYSADFLEGADKLIKSVIASLHTWQSRLDGARWCQR